MENGYKKITNTIYKFMINYKNNKVTTDVYIQFCAPSSAKMPYVYFKSDLITPMTTLFK
jgi:hypothetical protein